MMIHVLKWHNVAVYPRHSSLSHLKHSIQTSMSVLLAAPEDGLGPAAKTNRDLMFYWKSQPV